MRLALGVEYLGGSFAGWQRQDNQSTIQESLENALSKVADQPIQTICAGRTDAGVHAVGQVVHFDTSQNRPLHAWLIGTNTYLPKTIAIQWVKIVDENFHARFSAEARSYRYFIYNAPIASALMRSHVTWYRRPLDEHTMHQAAQYLLGEQDFSSFRSSQCESHSPMRCVESILVRRSGPFVVIEVIANAFLHHMVRNIVGVLLQVGCGDASHEWVKEVLLARDRRVAGKTAPPEGLYLYQVRYPDVYDFPDVMNEWLP